MAPKAEHYKVVILPETLSAEEMETTLNVWRRKDYKIVTSSFKEGKKGEIGKVIVIMEWDNET